MQEFPAIQKQQEDNTWHVSPAFVKMILVKVLDDADGHDEHRCENKDAGDGIVISPP